MFTTFIVKPIFNLLVLIYGILPGHNFGLALIIFTIVVRLLLWPLLRKQLHQTKIMRSLQPEVKRIKQQTKGDRQKEMQMTMELYKERGFNQFAAFPTLIIQFIILIGLYSGLHRVITNPHNLVTFAYPALQHLSWMEQLSHNIHLFDNTLFGVVDLSRAATGPKGLYLPALIIVIGSAVVQFFQSKQLLPSDKEGRSLRQILRNSGDGAQQPDQSEVNAAISKNTVYLLPVMIFLVTVRFASALSLYWFVGGLVAYIQQSIILREDETELENVGAKSSKNIESIPEAEVIASPVSQIKPKKKKAKTTSTSAKKRRKK